MSNMYVLSYNNYVLLTPQALFSSVFESNIYAIVLELLEVSI